MATNDIKSMLLRIGVINRFSKTEKYLKEGGEPNVTKQAKRGLDAKWSASPVFMVYNILLKFLFAIPGLTPYLFEFLERLREGTTSEDDIASSTHAVPHLVNSRTARNISCTL